MSDTLPEETPPTDTPPTADLPATDTSSTPDSPVAPVMPEENLENPGLPEEVDTVSLQLPRWAVVVLSDPEGKVLGDINNARDLLRNQL